MISALDSYIRKRLLFAPLWKCTRFLFVGSKVNSLQVLGFSPKLRVYAYKKPEIVYSCMPCPSFFTLFLWPGKTKEFLNDCAYFTALNDMSSDL